MTEKSYEQYEIILFYKYVRIIDAEQVKIWHDDICARLSLTGRCIIATEGINATFEGTKENVKEYVQELEKDERFRNIHYKYSIGTGKAFPRLTVKVRKEIVSLNLSVCDIDPNAITGIHLKPEELHEWLHPKGSPDLFLNDLGIKTGREFYIVDMRNAYEHKVGHFENSIMPPIENFRDLPKVVEQIAHLKNKTILTVCTGGVRCEKASGFLIMQGFTDVYQLDGGIVSYMEKYPNEDFQGKLYVFDKRITMGYYTDDPKHKIVGKCDNCKESSENYINCANPVCHRHFIICSECISRGGGMAFCPLGCVLSRHGRKISGVEMDLA
ncbi:MAG TPA: rhodanese-related sulfurtransferase [Candidatus Paceibacterota bacterium]|nr:rhodanese-related sulfurtransferase [Candidatus Paceibacterota bacterium]